MQFVVSISKVPVKVSQTFVFIVQNFRHSIFFTTFSDCFKHSGDQLTEDCQIIDQSEKRLE
jgi:hypothetical protein